MKAQLVFNLPEDAQEFHDAMHGAKYRDILDGVRDKIRSILKYGTEEDLETVLEKLREDLPTT